MNLDLQKFLQQLSGEGVTTAFIFFRFPDAPSIVRAEPIIWQYDDIFPDFPKTHAFVDYWHREVHGPLHAMRIGHPKLPSPIDIKIPNSEFRLH